jgi:hypothetical protein
MFGKEKSKFDEMAKAEKSTTVKKRITGQLRGQEDKGPQKTAVWILPVLFRIVIQDQIHKPWHLYWRHGKKKSLVRCGIT